MIHEHGNGFLEPNRERHERWVMRQRLKTDLRSVQAFSCMVQPDLIWHSELFQVCRSQEVTVLKERSRVNRNKLTGKRRTCWWVVILREWKQKLRRRRRRRLWCSIKFSAIISFSYLELGEILWEKSSTEVVDANTGLQIPECNTFRQWQRLALAS